MAGRTDHVHGVNMGYVSNAGLVLCARDTCIGIDCFCKDPEGLYPDTSQEMKEKLWKAIEQGYLMSLLFTHEHGDHFYAPDVVRAWRQNPALRIYSNAAVCQMLREEGVSEEALWTFGESAGKDHESGSVSDAGSQWEIIGPFRIGFQKTRHEGARYSGVGNLTLFIEVENRKMVVAGDAAACPELFEAIGVWCAKPDWLFTPFPYVGLPSSRRMLANALEPSNIFVLHQPKKEADVQNWVLHAKEVCQRAKDALPMPVFPEKPGGWWLM